MVAQDAKGTEPETMATGKDKTSHTKETKEFQISPKMKMQKSKRKELQKQIK